MYERIKIVIGAALSAMIAVGCAQDGFYDEDVAAVEQQLVVNNGTQLNGLHLNGLHLNGLHLNGLHLNGLHLNGTAIKGVTLQGTLFFGSLDGTTPLAGFDFVGAKATGVLSDGSTIEMRSDDIVPSVDPEIALYMVSYRAPGGAFHPLCLDRQGVPAAALPLAGAWDESEGTPTGGSRIDDPSLFTFACEGYALAKCVEMGYKPWRTVLECNGMGSCQPRSLAPFHEACTRMLRADYCGNGTPMTRDGTAVDVIDSLGLQVSERPGWIFEAEWSVNGAVCVVNPRWRFLPSGEDDDETIRVRNYIKHTCPDRWAGASKSAGCGGPKSTFYSINGFNTPLDERTLLMTRNAGFYPFWH